MSTRKIAVVTGASSGIGEVYADRLAQRGYDLVLVARRLDRLDALAADITAKHGAHVRVLQADLTKDADLTHVESVLETNEDVALLVNNAGWAQFGSLAEVSVEDSISQIALNVTALTRLTQAVLPGFKARNEGTIINIGSVLGIHSLPTTAVYSGTKGYVQNFTRGLQDELADTAIRVQLVAPATTATEIWSNIGIPLSSLSNAMTVENLVDAALSGLDLGETITWPSVADATLWDAYDTARANLFAGSRSGAPAPRYGIR
jgi:short-subunit dehydrogenase